MQSESTTHSMSNNNNNNNNLVNGIQSGGGGGGLEIHPTNGGSPASPHSADSNSNAPTSSLSLLPGLVQSSRHLLLTTSSNNNNSDNSSSITPSISLIPIKQVRCTVVVSTQIPADQLNPAQHKCLFIH